MLWWLLIWNADLVHIVLLVETLSYFLSFVCFQYHITLIFSCMDLFPIAWRLQDLPSFKWKNTVVISIIDNDIIQTIKDTVGRSNSRVTFWASAVLIFLLELMHPAWRKLCPSSVLLPHPFIDKSSLKKQIISSSGFLHRRRSRWGDFGVLAHRNVAF